MQKYKILWIWAIWGGLLGMGCYYEAKVKDLQEQRQMANETSAIGTLRALLSAQRMFYMMRHKKDSATGVPLYGNFQELYDKKQFMAWDRGKRPKNPTQATKSNYTFRVKLIGEPEGRQYQIFAIPQSAQEGSRTFLLDSRTEQIHYKNSATVLPTNKDPVAN